MSPQKKYYDLNVPLSSTSAAGATSTSWTRKQLAQIYQTRLNQLGYSGIAFCHTAYGRLDENKDDADLVLPWRDLISDAKAVMKDETGCTFGYKSSNGMSIHRRINIVLEEVTDVSRLLLPTNEQSAASIGKVLQKYDIVSLQPMNEPTLQNICEMLPSSSSSDGSSGSSLAVDILSLEYATGSRGGYGLPYRIRKDNIIKAFEAGVTFEVCYATAMVDPKRRQGFMKTLTEFQSTYNSIQKKRMLLNKQIQKTGVKQCKSEQFPLLVSSGSRQNYSAGTDEGMVTLRSPNDVQFIVGPTTGGDAWIDKVEYNETKTKRKQNGIAMSAAEKVLAKARDRNLGVVTHQSHVNQKKRRLRDQTDDMIRAHVSGVSIGQHQKRSGASKEESDDDSAVGNPNSLIDWLSEPITLKDTSENNANDDASDAEEDLMGIEPLKDEVASDEKAMRDDKQIMGDDEDLEDGYLAL